MPDAHEFHMIIENGVVYDGRGGDGRPAHVGIGADGCVAAISEAPLDRTGCARVIDAAGRWVTPGFVDIHTHYDAELLLAPGLGESVRHGVTTVLVGSCSLGTVYADADDCADLFARVEALPHAYVRDALRGQRRTWHDPASYVDALEALPLGPNVAAMLGHSDVRVHTLGLARAVGEGAPPDRAELERMVACLDDALDAGFVGFSTMTNPWDKLAGERFRSKQLPSTYATWGEYRRFHRRLRARGRVLQSAPNLVNKINVLAFKAESASWGVRRPLKVSLITAADAKSSPWLAPLLGPAARLLNRLLGADLRWQGLPMPFELYADGIDLVVFEEFGAGRLALHLIDEAERNELFADEGYRRQFRKDYEARFTPRVWHRDLHDAVITACPDEALVGRSFGAIADDRGIHPVDAYLDLVAAHGPRIRWRTLIANHRPAVLRRLMADPAVQIGFADSGAHLRNMAFYNFPLHLLKLARDAQQAEVDFLSIGQAVERVTSELAAWYGLDAGVLEVGARADLCVIDPEGLDDALGGYHEAPVPAFGGLRRMVRRNDRAVRATVIGGRLAFHEGTFTPGYGASWRAGRFLRADTRQRALVSPMADPAPHRDAATA